MTDQLLSLPEVIRHIRHDFGWTQVEMAIALEVTGTSVYRYESGATAPTLRTLEYLWDITGDREKLVSERAFLEQTIRDRKAKTRSKNSTYIRKLHGSTEPRSNRYRPLLQIDFLASLTNRERDMLEATIAIERSDNEFVKRVLDALLEPFLPLYDELNGQSQDEPAPPKQEIKHT